MYFETYTIYIARIISYNMIYIYEMKIRLSL